MLIGKHGAQLLFRIISDGYERRSLIITTNIEFSKWGSIFTDDQMAAAMIDHLAHHGHILLFEGESYRMKHAFMRHALYDKMLAGSWVLLDDLLWYFPFIKHIGPLFQPSARRPVGWEGFVSGPPESLTYARGRRYNDPVMTWVERRRVSGCSPSRKLMKTGRNVGIGALR